MPILFADRGFTGHEYLSWYKLYNMNGRMYDPVVGRFLSADPYIQNPGFTQNYNRYSYCLNNPLKYTDPSGNQMTAYQYFMQNVLGESGGRGFDGYKGSDGLGGGGVDSGYYGSAGPSASGLNTADMINYLWYRGDVAGFWTPSTGFVFTHDGAFPGSKNGVQGIWYQSVSLEGHYQNWRDGVNSPDAYVNVSNKFIASSSSGGDPYQGAGMVNNLTFLGDGLATITTKFLVNEYRVGADVVEVIKGIKTVSKIGKLSNWLNIGSVGYDIIVGNIQSSTIADVTMIGAGLIIGVTVGPITAGFVGLVYGGTMLMGGQDAINNSFNGDWNLNLNKRIKAIYGR